MYPIVQAPNEILRLPTKFLDLTPEKLEKIIEEMKQTLISQTDPEGVGLAANQVNLPYKLFLARYDLPVGRQVLKKKSPIHVFLNPEITKQSQELQEDNHKGPLEGCLSLPKYYGVVKRYKWITLKYQNEKLEEVTETFTDFPATVIQHEMDHLNGKIFVERVLEQGGKLYRVTRKPARNASHSDAGGNKKGKEEWEEVEL